MPTETPLERYTIKERVGLGGMAEVFLATDTVLERNVALKMMHPHLMHRPETLRRFFNEARSIAQLNHDNIVRVYDFGTGNRPFIVMEYVDGLTLAAALERFGALSNQTVLELGLQVLRGLDYTHRKGICHRDIKPANLIIDRNGLVRITDFGIAYLVNAESMTLTGSIVGSPHFIAPEQLSGNSVTVKTDIFSLGIVLYLCCTGSLPFTGDTPHAVINSLLHARPDRISNTHPRVLIRLAELIEACISKDPDARPDAAGATAWLQSMCEDISLQSGTERLAWLCAKSEAPAHEDRELFDLFCAEGRRANSAGQTIRSLRAFDQASRFQQLSADDQKLRNRIHASSRERPWRVIVIVFGVVLAGVIILLVQRRASVPAPPPFKLPGHVTPAARQSAPIGEPPVHPESSVTPMPTAPREKDLPDTTGTEQPIRAVVKTAAPSGTVAPPGSGDTTAHDENPPPPGFLVCRTNPPWVTLTIDGIESGQTPTAPMAMENGTHRLLLVKKGFTPFVDSFIITSRETTEVRIQLDTIGLERAVHE